MVGISIEPPSKNLLRIISYAVVDLMMLVMSMTPLDWRLEVGRLTRFQSFVSVVRLPP